MSKNSEGFGGPARPELGQETWPGIGDVLNRMADAVVQINRDGIVEAASRAVDVLFGWRPDELIGRPIAVLMGAPEAQAHQSFVDRYLETGQSGILNAAPRTLIGRHRSGGKVVFELTIGEAWVAGERKFIGVCRDASARVALEDERRDALEALRTKILELERARTELMAEQLKTRDRANAAVELSKREAVAKDNAVAARQVLSMAVNLADVHVWELNYRTRTLQKWGAEDTFFERPMSFRDLVQDPFATIHPDDRDEVILAWKRYLETGRPETLEYRINRRDGQEIWASSTTELLRDDAGRPHRLVGALQNVTRRKQADRSLIHALEQAEAATRAKSEFLANMSHEIRTPLNGVMGVTAALSRTPLSPAQSEMVGLIETSGQTLETLLADVLDLARIESGRLELKPESFDLAGCLKAAASLFQPGARDKGLDFTLSLGDGVDGDFVGDVTRIRQIVSNLLSNALKFTSRGAIALEAVLNDDGAVSITVRDSGIGFGPDVKDRLFERFEQADGSITRQFGGTGLGLAISRVLAEAMGGRLEAHSEPGVGSAFTLSVRLERSAERPAPPAPRAVVTRPDGRSARVLLAEDHPINRKVVELLLDGAGVDLTCVENGAEAVEAAAQEVYDLILMDMQMPVMDGLTAIRAIRARESASGRPAVQISTLSANAMPQHVAASLDAGADGHICKPVDMAELFATIERAVAMRDGVDKVSLCI